MRVLVLGGTTEARGLCTKLAALGVETKVSLAGVVPDTTPYRVPARRGGFGGVAGLARFLSEHQYTALVDATHPFAAQMPRNAAEAARQTGIPWVMLKRSKWAWENGAHWSRFSSIESAVQALPRGAQAFLATGAGSIPVLKDRSDCRLVLRQMTDPGLVPKHFRVLQGRPGNRSEERELFRGLHISHLIAKNSGGPTRGKLDAAFDLRLPVYMVDRPQLPPGDVVQTVQGALDWLASIA